jgi:hypothetical protein
LYTNKFNNIDKTMNIIQVTVKENPSTSYKFLVDKTSPVSKLKENLSLSYKKKISFINNRTKKSIDERLSFIDNDLQDNDELLIILRLSGSYELKVRLVNNQNIHYVNITVDGSDTIEEVKTKLLNTNINNNFNLQNKILTLSYDDDILENDKMLRNYKINDTTIINCYY